MDEATISTQSATAGERSNMPMRKNRSPRNRFRYGSHKDDKIRPKVLYCAPGIHVSSTRTKQSIVYKEITLASS